MNKLNRVCESGLVKGVAIAASLALLPISNANAGVSDKDIQNDAKTTGDVVSYGLGTQGQRYSTLKTINEKNVSKLVPAFSYSFGGEKQRGQEAQPLVHNGKIFVTGSYSRVFAVGNAFVETFCNE